MTIPASGATSVNVQCIEALESLHAALGRYAHRTPSFLNDFQRKFEAAWAELTQDMKVRRSTLASVEEELASLDDTPDEETGEDPNSERRADLDDELARAQEKVDELAAAMRQVQAAHEEFQRRTGDFSTLASEHLPRSRQILQQHIDAIYHYRSIKPKLSADRSSTHASSTSGITSASPSEPDLPGAPSLSGLVRADLVACCVEALRKMPVLSREVWGRLSADRKALAVQEIEQRLAIAQGRPTLPVIPEWDASRIFGYYDGRTIHLNSRTWDDLAETIDTVAHEGRHAYQRYAIEHPGFHEDADEVATWEENLRPGAYLDSEMYGYARYEAQPVEADARAFAAAVRKIFDPSGGT